MIHFTDLLLQELGGIDKGIFPLLQVSLRDPRQMSYRPHNAGSANKCEQVLTGVWLLQKSIPLKDQKALTLRDNGRITVIEYQVLFVLEMRKRDCGMWKVGGSFVSILSLSF